jgi:hypothetical protein
MRANLPHPDRTEFQFTSFGSVAEPIYLLPKPSQFTSSARRLSVVIHNRNFRVGRVGVYILNFSFGRQSSLPTLRIVTTFRTH